MELILTDVNGDDKADAVLRMVNGKWEPKPAGGHVRCHILYQTIAGQAVQGTEVGEGRIGGLSLLFGFRKERSDMLNAKSAPSGNA